MTQRLHPNTAFTCQECGKLCYRSRAEAKRAAKTHGANRRAYRGCGGYWHLASYQPAGKVAWYRERAR